jgi:hypothetical protein
LNKAKVSKVASFPGGEFDLYFISFSRFSQESNSGNMPHRLFISDFIFYSAQSVQPVPPGLSFRY